MKRFSEITSVSWGFFLVCLALLAGPCIWLTYQYTFDSTTTGTRIGLGITLAAVITALLTYVANEVLFRINGSEDDEES